MLEHYEHGAIDASTDMLRDQSESQPFHLLVLILSLSMPDVLTARTGLKLYLHVTQQHS